MAPETKAIDERQFLAAKKPDQTEKERLNFGAQLLGFPDYETLISDDEALKRIVNAWSDDEVI